MKNRNLIAISGYKGSGKDTVGKMLQYLFCEGFSIMEENRELDDRSIEDYLDRDNFNDISEYEIKKFADPLKRFVADILNVSVEKLEDREFKESELGEEWHYYKNQNINVRGLMIEIGHGLRVSLHENIWINALFSKYSNKSKWIITDLRYHNELNTIKEKGGITIRVNRKGTKPALTDTFLDDYKNWDFIIENDGTIEDLFNKIKLLKSKLLWK